MSTNPETMAPELLRQNANQQFNEQKWQAARATYIELLAVLPRDPDALLQLSYVESALGNFRAAHECAMQAAALDFSNPELIATLVARLRTFSEAEVMMAAIQRLPPVSDIQITPLLELAAQLSYLNEQDRSLVFLEEAKRADPDFPPTQMAFAQISTYLGRFDEAEHYFERCIGRAPQAAQAHWFLSRLRKQTPGANHVSRLCKQLQQRPAGREDKALLYFALHKELDDLEDFPAAWEALQRACQEKRALLNYQSADSRQLVDRLIAWSGNKAPRSPTAPDTSGEYTPIFVVGMHRSGTTLLEQMLDIHSDIRGIGELYDFTNQMRYATDRNCRGPIDATLIERAVSVDFADVGNRYIERMRWRLGTERYFTDKLPSNFLNVGFICEALPAAKILHMVRDPVETCFSNLRELFSDVNAYSYDQNELADFYLQYQRLMKHWHTEYPGRILDVSYSELTRDPETELRRVTEFCGIEFQDAMLDIKQNKRGIATASAIQVREGVVRRDRPKWAPYARQLQPLITALRQGGIEVSEVAA